MHVYVGHCSGQSRIMRDELVDSRATQAIISFFTNKELALFIKLLYIAPIHARPKFLLAKYGFSTNFVS